MAGDKKLKFEVVLDQASFQAAKRALGELNTEAAKLAKSLSGSGGLFSGATVGKPFSAAQTIGQSAGKQKLSIGSAILGDANAFKALAQSGKTGMDAMTNAVRNGVREQMKEIERLEGKMARLQERFRKDPRAAYEGAFATGLSSQMIQRQGQIGAAQGQLASLQQAGVAAGIQGIPGVTAAAAGGPGGPGFMTRAGQALGIQGVMPSGIGGMVGIGGLIAAGVAAAVHETMAGTRTYTTQESQRSQLMNSEIRRVRGGDVTGLMALKTMLQDPSRAQDFRDQAGRGARAEAAMGGLGSVAKGAVNAVTMGLFGQLTGGGGPQGILTGLSDASMNTTQMQGALQQAKAFETSTSFLSKKMALERFYGDFGNRKSVGRILGTGLSINPVTGMPQDTHLALEAKMTAAGFSGSEYAGAYSGAREMAGRDFARRNATAIMSAQAAGFGGYGHMLAAAERSGGMAGLALGGKIDKTAGIQLGQGVFGTGFDVRGTTSGIGILSAAQGPGFNFTGGVGDMNEVQRVLAGMQLGSSITTGGLDTYQAGRNIISAINLNPEGSTYAQDYLGTGMSMKQLTDAARGNLTNTAQSMGITAEMARGQISSSMGSILERFQDQGGNDLMSRAIRGYRESGMDITEYTKSLYATGRRKEARAIGDVYGILSGEGEEAGEGLIGLIGGVDTEGVLGRGPRAGRGAMEKAVDEQQAESMKQDRIELETMYKGMMESLKLAPAAAKVFGSGGDLSKSAEDFITALDNLSTAVNERAFIISQGKSGHQAPVKTTAGAPKDKTHGLSTKQ